MRYVLWAEFIDGRKLHETYVPNQSDAAELRFVEVCGMAGVDHVLLTLNGNVVDSWGT